MFVCILLSSANWQLIAIGCSVFLIESVPVIYALLSPPLLSLSHTHTHMYRFVEFGTIREMEDAIQLFDNYDTGGEKKLVVKVSEDRERREERTAWIKNDQEFLNSLNATGELDITSVNKDVPDNPLEPRYMPPNPSSPEKPTPPASEFGGPPRSDIFGSSGGAASLKASPPSMEKEGKVIDSSLQEETKERSGSPSSETGKGKLCHVCRKPTTCRCRCNVPYCSKECQRLDWPVHGKICAGKKKNVAIESDKPSTGSEESKVERVAPVNISYGPLEGFQVFSGNEDVPEEEEEECESASGGRHVSLSSGGDRSVPAASPVSDRRNIATDVFASLPTSLKLSQSTDEPSKFLSFSPKQRLDDVGSCLPSTPPGDPPSPVQSSDQLTEKTLDRRVNYLSTREILSVFDHCPSPLSSHPVGEFPPKQFIGIVTNVFSSSQFHAIVASSSIKEALVKLLKYGSSVTPVFCGPADLRESSLYGYVDDHGDFYRVELSFSSGLVELYDVGAKRFSVRKERLFHLSDEIKSIPRLCYQLTLRGLYYDSNKKDDGIKFLFGLVKGRPMTITNHSTGVYANKKEINFIISTLTSLDGNTSVNDQVVENGFAKVVNKEGSNKGGSQWPMSHQKTPPDSLLGVKDSSPSKKFSVMSTSFGERGERDRRSAPSSLDRTESSETTQQRSPLLSTPDMRRALFIDGSPDKLGTRQNLVNKQQMSLELRPVTPPTLSVPQPDGTSDRKYKLIQMSNKVPFHNPEVGVMIEIRPVVVLNPHIIWAQVMHNRVDNFKKMETDLNSIYSSRKHEPYAPTPGEIVAARFAQDQKYYRVEVLCVNHTGTVDIRFVDYGNRETVTMSQIHHLEPIFLSLPKQALHFSLVGVVPVDMATSWSDNAMAYLKEKILNRRVLVKIVMQTPSTCMAEVWDPDSPTQMINASLVQLGLAQAHQEMNAFGIGSLPLIRGVSLQDRPKPQSEEHERPPLLQRSLSEQSSVTLSSTSKSPLQDVLLKPKDFEKPFTPSPVNTSLPALSSSMTERSTSQSLSSPSTPTKVDGWSPKKPTTPLNTSTDGDESSKFNGRSPPSLQTQTSRRPQRSGQKVTIEYIELEANEEPVEAVVLYIENPLKFWIQVVNKELINSFTRMNNELCHVNLTPRVNPSRGDFCLCGFPGDGGIYRAKVLDVESNPVLVQRVDYGDRRQVSAEDVFQLTPEFATMPARAIQCTLNQLLNPNGKGKSWRQEAMDFFTDMVGFRNSEIVNVRCVNVVGRAVHVVNVQTPPGKGGEDLLNLMVKAEVGGSIFIKSPRRGGKGGNDRRRSSDLPQSLAVGSSPSKQETTSVSPFSMTRSNQLNSKGQPSSSPTSPLAPPSSPFGKRSTSIQSKSTFQVSDLKGVSLPSNNEAFYVLVTEVHSPGKFYVQTVDTSGMLDEMFLSLNRYFSSNKSPSLVRPPSAGSLVCAKFSQDGAWYRGEVLETSADSCRVRFIDYGNIEIVHLCDMAECPCDFISFPILATHCCLHGVTPPTGSSTWTDGAIQLFKKLSSDTLLQAVIVNPNAPIPSLKLTNTSNSGNVDLAAQLIVEGVAAASSTPPRKESPKQEKVCDSKEIPVTLPVRPKPDTASYPRVKSLQKISLPFNNESFSLLVTEVYSPDEFYIQILDSCDKLSKLSSSLNEYFSSNKSPSLSSRPSAGSLVCAMFSQDGAWYRGEVLETSADSCRVRFIDYGNIEIVQLCDMAECPCDFISFPILATHCCLHGVTPPTGSSTWTDGAIQLFKKLSSDTLLQAVIVNPNAPIPSLKLTNTSNSGNVDLAAQLIVEGVAAASSTPPTKESTKQKQVWDSIKPGSASFTKVKSLQKISLPSNNESFSLLVTEVYSPDEFYIQILDSCELLSKLSSSLNEYFSSNKSPSLSSPPSAGSLVCAMFSQDGAWYRGEVLETSSDSCRVRFIDYGNIEIVHLCDMAECPHDFISFPILATHCCLHGVTPPTGSSTWSDGAIQLFKKLSSDTLLQAVIVNPNAPIPSLKLTNTSNSGNVDLAAQLIVEGVAAASSTPSRKESPKQEKVCDSKEIPVTLPARPKPDAASYSRVESLQKISLPSNNESFSLLVTEVYSPDEFYIQILDSCELLSKLSSSLNEYFSSNKSPSLIHPPSAGSLVSAMFSQDGAWYRGEVLETSADSCRVRFIDYGNIEIVQLCDMAECPCDFVSFPILATRCCLHGVTPPTGSSTWSDGAIQLFKKLSSDTLLQAVIVNPNAPIPSLKLTNTSNSGNVDLAAQLIVEGVAAASSTPPRKESPKQEKVCDSKEIPVTLPVRPKPDTASYPRVESLQKISLPSNESFSLLVTEVYSPDEFYIQVLDSCDKLSELSSSLNEYFSSNKSPSLSSPPSAGSLVCAMFSQDGAWYRGEVLETSADSCRVRFIDYGNIEIVQLCDMAECPCDFISFPILATHCCLHGVTPPTGSSTWSDGAIQLFKKLSSDTLLQAVIVNPNAPIPSLKLTNTSNSGNVDLAAQLIVEGVAAASSTPSRKESPKQEKVCDSKEIPVTLPARPKPDAVSYPRVESLQKISLPSNNESFSLLVTEVYSPDEFYIQILDSCDKLSKLSSSLNEYFSSNKSPSLIHPPSAGSLVCAMFSQDGAWYRGEVLETSADSCRVRFIDYGNIEIVQLCNMAECPRDFISFPILATHCCLHGVTPPTGSSTWTDGAIQLFKKLSSDTLLQAVIVNPNAPIPSLKLTNTSNSGNVDLAAQLIVEGVAAASSTPPRKDSPKQKQVWDSIKPGSASFTKVKSLQKISLPSNNESFSLLVTEVYSPDEFYIQILDSCDKLSELSSSLNEYFSSNKSPSLSSPPSAGSLVCAMFSQDGAWYRGEVLETSADSCRVRFIDYGNIEIVQLCDMAECPCDFVSFPILATHCCLHGLTPPTGDATWSASATQLLKEMSTDRIIQGAVVDCFRSLPSIQLQDISGVDLASKLVSKGVAVTKVSQSTSPSSSTLNKNVPPPKLPKVADLHKAKLPGKSSYFTVLVTEVVNPHAFFVQMADIDTFTSLDKLQKGLDLHFHKQPPSPLPHLPSRGSLVCARYSQDKVWYRGEVIESHDNFCKVLFIDYGNVEVSKLDDMTACPAEFVSYPISATKCSLNGVVPLVSSDHGGEESWSVGATAEFRKLTFEIILKAKVVGEGKDGVTLVELVNTNESPDVYLAAELISLGVAKSSNPSITRAAPVTNDAPPMSSRSLDIPTVDIPTGVSIEVHVPVIIDPSSFFVQHRDRNLMSAFRDLMMKIQSTYNSSSSNYRGFVPLVGGVCCCQATDNSWYRSRIVKVKGRIAAVQSIDFGFVEELPQDKLLHLDSDFSTMPAQAVQCSLSGVQPTSAFGWSEASKTMFKKLVGKKVRAVIQPQPTGSKKAATLFTSEGEENVAAALINGGYASEVGATHPKPAKPETSKSQSDTEHSVVQNDLPLLPLPHCPIPSAKTFSVNMTHTESLSEIYFNVATKERIIELCELLQAVHDYAQDACGFKQLPDVGSLCIAMYSDGSWYRAQVIKVVDKETCLVVFFDFGNTENVSLSKMKPITEEKLLTYPVQALKCGLYGASLVDSSKKSEAMTLFTTLVPRESMKTCHVVSKFPLLVDLDCGSGFPTLSVREELARAGYIPKPSDLGMVSLPMNKLPVDGNSVVLLSEINDPSDFWLQVIDEAVEKRFAKMMIEIHHYADSGKNPPISSPFLGQLCIANFSQDKIWYRAKVVHLAEDGKVRVQFVDYGNEETMDASRLVPFKHSFMSLPSQAIRCSLVGFKVATPSLKSKFVQMVENKKLIATNESTPGEDRTSILLIDTSGDDNVYVHDELIKP